MLDLSFDNKLLNIIPEERLFRDEPMYKHITFRVGGNVERYISVANVDEIKSVLELCRLENVPSWLIGNGSNLLVSDAGLPGVCIEIGTNMKDISILGEEDGRLTVSASAGVLLSSLAAFALKNSLTGLEFAAGIPGTVGGAMVMNAGAYGGEMKDVVKSVTALDPNSGEVITISCEDMAFGYRTSCIKSRGLIVVAVDFTLEKGDETEIKATMDDLAKRRRDKQPLEFPSAGSTFKRPEGFFAGKLIQDSGLMGYAVGDAEVSTKHAGFVVNKGKATATDIYRLIREVQEAVYADTGIRLEPEVIMLGEFRM